MRVIILFPRSVNEPQGLSKVVKMFYENIHLFQKNGVEMKVISRDTIVGHNITYENGYNQTFSGFVGRFRHLLLKLINDNAKNNNLFAKIIITYSYIRWSKKVVSYYFNDKTNDTADVFLFHDSITCYEFMKRAKEEHPIICMIHSIGIPMFGYNINYPKLSKTRFYKKLFKREIYVMNKVKAYGFVSKTSIDNFVNCMPEYPKNKLFYIHNGMTDIPTNNEKRHENTLRVICVAGICHHKGQERIVNAIIELNKENKYPDNVIFEFVGNGDIVDSLKECLVNEGVDRYVNFSGQINNVDEHLFNSDIFILPTSNDGLPMAIIEAMRASLPIVSTRIGGIPEMIIDKENGIFIEPSVEGVKSFLIDIEKYDWFKMGIKSREHFLKYFTIDSMIEEYVEIINKVSNE